MALAAVPKTKALANTVVVFLTTPPAATTGIATLAEVNAGLKAACHIFGDFNPTATQATGEGPAVMCEEYSETEFGRTTYEPVEVLYSYMPQELGTPGADGNELYEALEPDAIVTAVVLHGINAKTDTLAAGDISDQFLMEAGTRRKDKTGDGDMDKKAVRQFLRVVNGGPIVEDHPLAS